MSAQDGQPKQARAPTAEGELREFVTVHIADQLFGVEVSRIHDVFTPVGLTQVPLARPEIAGVLNLRGRIVTTFDGRACLGLPKREDDRKGSMAIGVEKNGEAYGLIVDSVGEVLRLSDDRYEANPSNLDPRWQDAALGVYRLEERLLIVLNLDGILEIAPQDLAAAS